MADQRNRFRDDPLLSASGQGMLAAARAYMDEYALEIFDLWFGGKAAGEVVFDNPRWAAYMQADQGLSGQIDRHLTTFALKFRDDFFKRNPAAKPVVPSQPYQTCFHAEVGPSSGGYRTGYSQLHGSNQSAGDFKMQGLVSMAPGAASKLDVTFTGNLLTFNDKVDPNFKYKSDAVFANLAKNLAASGNGPAPRDYILRIRWREQGPWTYSIPAAPSKPGSPDWLKPYPSLP
jgi:hypothetical protein